MSQKIPILTLTFTATAALKAERLVTAAGAYPAAGGHAVGVSTTDAASGALLAVDVLGVSAVIAGDAIAAGAYVQAGADGKVVTHAGGKAVGIALDAAADGDRLRVLLVPNVP